MAQTQGETTGWVGWIYFASMIMLILGGLQALAGLVALFRKAFYVAPHATHGLIVWNYAAWGWINIVLGILVFMVGLALVSGRTWARIAASFIVVVNAIGNLAFLSAYPLWSIIALIIDGFVLYAITVHGREVSKD